MLRHKITLTLAATTTGLIAGLLFAFQVAVNPAFATLPDASYIAAMQAINEAIQNPTFAVCFFGAPILLGISAWQHYKQRAQGFRLLALAAAVYIVGVLGITFGGNVPLNNRLAVVPIRSASAAELASARAGFQTPWNTFHAIRTAASVAALVIVLLASQTRNSDGETP